jgi:hypothetical protein
VDGTSAILEFEEDEDADVVFAENATGGLFLEKAEDFVSTTPSSRRPSR